MYKRTILSDDLEGSENAKILILYCYRTRLGPFYIILIFYFIFNLNVVILFYFLSYYQLGKFKFLKKKVYKEKYT
jgi:hypothetical protein